MEELEKVESLEDKTVRKGATTEIDIPDNLSNEAVSRIKKSRFIKICIFIGLDILLFGYLIYEIVTVFKVVIEHFPH